MTLDELKRLRPGDFIRHYLAGDLWLITAPATAPVLAAATEPGASPVAIALRAAVISSDNASEWNVVPRRALRRSAKPQPKEHRK